MALRISQDLALSPDFATKTAGILAQRRKGKSYTASVIAEEMVAAGIPFVALDPTGAWWGLRAGADGKGAGLSVVILGGQHGDLPLERGAGRFVADLVVEHPGFYVIDFSLFPSAAAEPTASLLSECRLATSACSEPSRHWCVVAGCEGSARHLSPSARRSSTRTSWNSSTC